MSAALSLFYAVAHGRTPAVFTSSTSTEFLMSFTSTIQVLKVENEQRTSKRTGKEYTHFAARCITLDDDGQVDNVGVIRSDLVVPELRDAIRVGTFRATFGLKVPDFGENKGDLVAMLTGLVPFPQKQATATPAPAAPAAAK